MAATMVAKAKRPAHRPKIMQDGRRRNVYIDDASWELAKTIGGGNVSDGIRQALKIAILEFSLSVNTKKGKQE
jgi:hypothetical protein